MKPKLAIVLAVAFAATSAYAQAPAPHADAVTPAEMSRVFPQPSFLDYPALAITAGEASVGASAVAADGRIATLPQPSFVDCPPAVAGDASVGSSAATGSGEVMCPPSFQDYPSAVPQRPRL